MEENGMTAQRTALSPAAASRSREMNDLTAINAKLVNELRTVAASFDRDKRAQMASLLRRAADRINYLERKVHDRGAARSAAEPASGEGVNNTIAESEDNKRG